MNIKDMTLETYLEDVPNYTELRVQKNTDERLVYVNGNLLENDDSSNQGVSARSFKNGSWGFASSSNIDDDTIMSIVQEANQNATFLAKKMNQDKTLKHHEEVVSINDYTSDKKSWTKKDKISLLQEIDEYIQKNYEDLVSRKIYFITQKMEKNMMNSTDSKRVSIWQRTMLYVILSAKDTSDEIIEVYNVIGGRGEAADILSDKQKIFNEMDEIYKHLEAKKTAVHAEAGIKDVILDADLAGILAHEAVGHTVEADLVRNGSIAADYLDKKVASDLVTMVDFAYEFENDLCPVPIYVDDEGTKGKDAILIKDGVLKNYMHNKDSADHYEMEANGNARAYQFSDEPLIRMRNTAIIPGDSSLAEMIASIDDGYYLVKTSNGQADFTGEFMFGITVGYEIKNGKIGKAIKDTTISGLAFDVLKSVDMISNDMKWAASGMCGKKQPIPVGMGGPAIKCKVNIGGR